MGALVLLSLWGPNRNVNPHSEDGCVCEDILADQRNICRLTLGFKKKVRIRLGLGIQ